MSLGTILLVVLVLLLLGVIPTWPHSKQWGCFPSGGIGLVLLILVILILLGKISPRGRGCGGYSCRSASIGSSCAARRAGK